MRVQTTDDRLLVEIELAVPVAQVWAALTSPAAVSDWWGDHVRLAPYVGGELREEWTTASYTYPSRRSRSASSADRSSGGP